MRPPHWTRWTIAATVALASVLAPPGVDAQVWVGSATPRRGTVEVSGGAAWNAGQDLPAQAAALTQNPTAGTGGFNLFRTDATLDPVIGAQVKLGYFLTRAVSLEAGLRYSRPQLDVRLSQDFEGAPDITASTTLTQYVFTGSLLYHFGARRAWTPFIGAGGGHLRDVHAGNELVETGTEFHGIGGVKFWFGTGRRRLGLRAEGGVSVISGGFTFEDDRRIAPIASAGLTYVF